MLHQIPPNDPHPPTLTRRALGPFSLTSLLPPVLEVIYLTAAELTGSIPRLGTRGE